MNIRTLSKKEREIERERYTVKRLVHTYEFRWLFYGDTKYILLQHMFYSGRCRGFGGGEVQGSCGWVSYGAMGDGDAF